MLFQNSTQPDIYLVRVFICITTGSRDGRDTSASSALRRQSSTKDGAIDISDPAVKDEKKEEKLPAPAR